MSLSELLKNTKKSISFVSLKIFWKTVLSMGCGQHGDQWEFISNKMNFLLIIAKSKVQGSPNRRTYPRTAWSRTSQILGARKDDELNCNERDELFNSIFTTASITFGVGAFCFGLLADRFGIFVGRLTSFSFVSIGLTVLILILKRIIPEVRISVDHFHSFLAPETRPSFRSSILIQLESLETVQFRHDSVEHRFLFRIHGYG